jgi:2-dehydropantoate 2-reductase
MITARLESMVEVMGSVGITKSTTNLWGQRWAKLGTNCMANALAAVSGLTSFELRDDPVAGEIAVKLVAEVIQVAISFGVHVEDVNGQTPASYLEAVKSHESMKLLREELIEQGKSLGEGRPSLAQDVMKGRKTEIEHLNGYVISKGRELGVSTPANDALYRMAKELEAGEIDPSPANLKFIDN